MRILQIRFKNLNSLAGEWQIDLTHPAFADGIFAITGPTGAGKTTILDAICLALYGRTPRLAKADLADKDKKESQILSRQTGDGFAEVEFTVRRDDQSKRFRCRWTQRRARQKAGGKLQDIVREIADITAGADGAILAAKTAEVEALVADLTGMTYEQFSQSILLAQGGFAKFLQAAPDERSPLLEQITRTEIYSEISIAAHARYAAEKKQLEMLAAAIAGEPSLTAAAEQQLREQLAARENEEQLLAAPTQALRTAVNWRREIARLASEAAHLDAQENDWRRRAEIFAPQLARLTAAEKTLDLAADDAVLAALRREQAAERQQLSAIRAELPAAQTAAQNAEAVAAAAAQKWQAAASAHTSYAPLGRQTRLLDAQIAEKERTLTHLAAEISRQEKTRDALAAEQAAALAERESVRRQLAATLETLAASAGDERLVAEFSGIANRLAQAQAIDAAAAAADAAAAQAVARAAQTADVWQRQQAHWRQAQTGLADARKTLAAQQAERQKFPPDAALRRELQRLEQEQRQLADAMEWQGARVAAQTALAANWARQATLADAVRDLTAELVRVNERRQALENECRWRREKVILLNKIAAYETDRAHLRDGQPCPLCGALSHPLAFPVAPNAAELAGAEDALRAINETVADRRSVLARAENDRQHALAEEANLTRALADLDQKLTGVFPDAVPAAAELARRQAANLEQRRSAAALARQVEELEKTIRDQQIMSEQAQAAAAQAERDAQTAQHQNETAARDAARLNAEVAERRRQSERLWAALAAETQIFGGAVLTAANAAATQALLADRRRLWLERQAEKETLTRRGERLTAQYDERAKQQAHLATEDRRAEWQRQQSEIADRRERRRQLAGDENPDDAEKCLSDALARAESEAATARQNAETARRKFAQKKADAARLLPSIAARENSLTAQTAAFGRRLRERGFADESAYQAAGMPAAEREELRRQAAQLQDEQTTLAALRQKNVAQLTQEREKNLATATLAELTAQLAAAEEQQRAQQNAVGALRQQIAANEARKSAVAARREKHDRQKEQCDRWGALAELIGSHDGKKFRNFAQGLTFEMMVRHANAQLRRLTDRYRLTRDHREPLNLNVIDDYQAGEIRSTKNLSGGESFLVSLALALGLSRMVSRRLSVDSLFLDEGFGTLDDEALATALKALSGLRQDGKLIGVISHVEALKERINARIEVTPRSGGRSGLIGPGCAEKH
ncbi:MAG: AAA family ATPase [Planctomycetota bacterium]|jgi:exonuclease SbcC|nr:AAA family ATPase [Planctomycetota bacterium]